ncbi:MAG: hypothetical protein U0S36_00080, partial [Candidatus Nanopelagicales bacterium]
MTASTRTPDATSAARHITAHFDEFAPDYDVTAFGGAGMARLSRIDLDNVRRAAALATGTDTAGGADTRRRACDVGVGTGRISRELVRL